VQVQGRWNPADGLKRQKTPEPFRIWISSDTLIVIMYSIA